MDPFERIVLREAKGREVSNAAVQRKAIVCRQIGARLHCGNHTQTVAFAEEVVPMGDALVVVKLAIVSGRHIVRGEPGDVGFRV